jgi:hypothetical protein
MTPEDSDLTLRPLGRLAVVEPDRTRSERVRLRCRAAIAAQPRRDAAAPRFTAIVLESGLMLGLSVVYLSAMIYDVVQVYIRQ